MNVNRDPKTSGAAEEKKMKLRTLTTEEITALRAYADLHGRTWKQQLRDAWMDASEPGILQMLRNDPDFGPSGLNKFKFEVGDR
jgi:hypothetical protein